MKVGDLIKKPPVVVGLDATVEDVAVQMVENNVGSVVVVDSERRPVAIVTERDVVRTIARRTPPTAKAAEVGTARDLLTAKPDDDLYQVLDAMRKRRVRHLIVVDEGGRLVGVLSIRDFTEDWALKELSGKVWWPKPEE